MGTRQPQIASSADPRGRTLALVYEVGDETISNARLIAAAPELLEALELALATLERVKPDSLPFDSTKGTKDFARAAIAKAKGGA